LGLISADKLARGAFAPHGTYRFSLSGHPTLSELIASFVTIEGQQGWNTDVVGGTWDSGVPATEGAIRTLQLKRGMWSRQQVTIVSDTRVQYLMLDAGGGMPLQQACIDVAITPPPDGVAGEIALTFEMRYRLGRAFRLMKGVVERAIRSNLDQNLRSLVA